MEDSESLSLEEPMLPRRTSDLPRKHRSSKDPEKILRGGSSREIVRLLAYKERDNDLKKMLSSVREQLRSETQRADAAEDKAREAALRFKHANDARIGAEQEAARANEALGLYKLQLANAQKEINRAQELLDSLEAQRLEAEEAATRARSTARRLKEEKLVQLAREEGRKLGMEEGLARGRNLGYEEDRAERYPRGRDAHMRTRPDLENVDDDMEILSDGQGGGVRQRSHSSGSCSRGYERERLSSYSQPLHRRATSVSPATIAPDPPPTRTSPADQPRDGAIHPISVQILSPSPSHPHVEIPPDGWIPKADEDQRIRIPPPHELAPPPPTPSPPTSITLLSTDDHTEVPPIMIPPPQDYLDSAVSDSDSINAAAQHRARYGRRRSSESQSTTMSQFDLLGPPVAPSGKRPLLSAIAEERERTSTIASSPAPQVQGSYQSPFLQSSRSSFFMPQGPPVQTQDVDPPIRLFSQDQNIYTRPRTPDSSPDSVHSAPRISLRPPSQASEHRQSVPHSLSSDFQITVEPPSRPESNHSGTAPTTPNLLSAGDADHPLPSLPEDATSPGVEAQPVIPQLSSRSFPMGHLDGDELPLGFMPTSPLAPPSTLIPQPAMPRPLPPSLRTTPQDFYVNSNSPAGAPLPPSSYSGTPAPSMASNMVAGAFPATESVVIPHLHGSSLAPDGQPERRYSRTALNDYSSDSEVSSGMGSSSVNTLTTPPNRRKKLPRQSTPSYPVAPVPPNVIYPVPTPRAVPNSLSGAAKVPLPPSAAGSVVSSLPGAARVPLPASTVGSVMSPGSSSQSYIYSRTPYNRSDLALDAGRTPGRMNTPLSPIIGSAHAEPTPLPIPTQMPFASPIQQPQLSLPPHVYGNDLNDDFTNVPDAAPMTMPSPIVIPSEQLSHASPVSSFISLAPSSAPSKTSKKPKKKGKGR